MNLEKEMEKLRPTQCPKATKPRYKTSSKKEKKAKYNENENENENKILLG